jgi:hypothetical protein
MPPEIQVLLAEYSELRQSERAVRSQLHVLGGFTVTVLFGMFVGVETYKMQPLVLAAPAVLYLLGYQCHSDAMLMFRIVSHCRTIERYIRKRVGAESTLPKGFEDAIPLAQGVHRTFYYANSFVGGAIFLRYYLFHIVLHVV